MASRVRELGLQLRLPDGPAEERSELTRRVEGGFLPAVLDALERLVHARFGGDAILRVRELRVHWRIGRHQLEDGDHAGRLARDLFDPLVQQLASGGAATLWPSASAAMVLFENRAHLWAAHLSDRAASRSLAWYHEGEVDQEDPWAEPCAAGPGGLSLTLSYVSRMGTLELVTAALAVEEARRLLDVLPAEEWPDEHVPPAVRRAATNGHGSRARGPADDESAPPAAGAASAGIGSEGGDGKPAGEAGSADGERAADERAAGLAERERVPGSLAAGAGGGAAVDPGLADAPVAASRHPDPHPRAVDAGRVEVGSEATPRSDWPASGGAAEPTGPARAAEAPSGARSHTGATGDDVVNAPPGWSEDGAGVPTLRTRFAGLFYTLRPLLELDLGEHLWCAGTVEGHLLFHVARALLGDESARDPAPAVLGGVDGRSDPVPAPIPDWAAQEIRAKSARSLRELAVRIRSPEGELRELDADVEETARSLAPRVPASVDDPATAACVAFCAAVVKRALELRLRERLELSAMADRLRVPARIERHPKELRIVMPLESIDIDIRRAGLDRNPGWVPWLGRKVVLEFEEPAAGPAAEDS